MQTQKIHIHGHTDTCRHRRYTYMDIQTHADTEDTHTWTYRHMQTQKIHIHGHTDTCRHRRYTYMDIQTHADTEDTQTHKHTDTPYW